MSDADGMLADEKVLDIDVWPKEFDSNGLWTLV